MYEINVDGYKMIFYLENLLREYIVYYFEETDLNPSQRAKLEQNLTINNIISPNDLGIMLKYCHLGELVDLIKSKKFSSKKSNNLNKVNISTLIKHRNNVMHSREIILEEAMEIQKNCHSVIVSLEDSNYETKWDTFTSRDIYNFTIPQLFLEYPVGKSFDKL